MREKQTLQSLMGDDFSIYDENGQEEDEESMFDSDEEHIEQYEKAAAEPLKYQEMPTPVCDSKQLAKSNLPTLQVLTFFFKFWMQLALTTKTA